jgi:hypothetical protein
MKLETLMANILINAYKTGRQNTGSMTDKKRAKDYAQGYTAALTLVQADLGMAFKRMKPEIKKMELMG